MCISVKRRWTTWAMVAKQRADGGEGIVRRFCKDVDVEVRLHGSKLIIDRRSVGVEHVIEKYN